VDQPLAAQRAVREPGQRVVQRLVAHPLLAAQPPERRCEHVRDRAQEALFVLPERALHTDLAEHLVPGGDLEPRHLAAVVPPAGQQLAGAPDLDEVERERLAHPLDRLDGQVADVGAR
jgi:hypothetical protein